VVRIHDLVHRTTQQVIDLGQPVMARFADADRRIVAWHDDRIAVVDPAAGQRRDLTAPAPLADLEVLGTGAFAADKTGALWRIDLAGGAPQRLPLEEAARWLAPSPDGRWIAVAGEHHLFLFDRMQPAAPAQELTLGETRDLAWSADGEFFAAQIDTSVIAYQMTPAPMLVDRVTVGQHLFVAHRNGRLYFLGQAGVAIRGADQSGEDGPPRSIIGQPVGLAEARGGTMIAGASDGITVISEDGDRMLPLQAARVERVVASPRSPYLLAQVEGRLLLWNLDDIQPRRLSDHPTGRAQLVDADHAIAGGGPGVPAQAIDLVHGQAVPLGEWADLRSASAAGPGGAVAIVDGAHRVHLIAPGREPEDLAGEIDLAAFATPTQLVVATDAGEVFVHDVARGQRMPLVSGHGPLLGLAWGRGHHAWVAAAFADGTLWRKNLATGATQTAPRVPPLDTRHLAEPDGKLLVDGNGGVMFLHDTDVHAWRPDGSFARLARAPKPLDELGEAGPDHVIAIAGDTTIYDIARAGGEITEALASIESRSAAMAPDTGTLVAIERGKLAILDPLVHQRWTLAVPSGVTYQHPAISADGRRVVANTAGSLLAWSIELPGSAEATARWLDAMTNAVDDPSPGGLGWR
jgi:hypothetical protein